MAAAESSDDHVRDRIDEQIRSLDASRISPLGSIATLALGYNVALRFAVDNLAFDVALGTASFCKRSV
jgi:hypothetical protein